MAKMPATDSGEASVLENDPRWQLAQRVVRNSALSRARQLRGILLYIVRQTILHPDEPVHEFDIAHRVLGRRSDFNPLDDSIVRVQMAHLRKRLEHYFATDGIHEEGVITIALGSYEPIFSQRAQVVAPTTEQKDAPDKGLTAAGLESPARPAATAPARQRRNRITGRFLLAAIWTATVLAAMWTGFHWRPAQVNSTRSTDISNPILRLVFAPNADVNVVLADTTLVSVQNMVHSDISIAEYLDPRYPDNVLAGTSDPALRSTLRAFTGSRYTSLDDADVVGQCFEKGTDLGSRAYVRYARYMHVRDFEHGNFVIVGSRRGNPWVSLFEPSLNFYFEEDPVTHIFHFRNRHPNPGEPQTYNLQTEPSGDTVGYVDIAILPNLSGTGVVLMLNGFSMETNEAAADLVFAKSLLPALNQALAHLSTNSKVEILLRVRNLDKSVSGWDIASLRISNP
jgi:hypothetical protein